MPDIQTTQDAEKAAEDARKADALRIAQVDASIVHCIKFELDMMERDTTTADIANSLLEMLKDGQIPHLTINY